MKQIKECRHEMRKGKAIKSTTVIHRDFAGADLHWMSYGGPGRLVSCMKCVKCGHSVNE